jgi:heme/copper-type cytochrome/quinol oxidase subunit 3
LTLEWPGRLLVSLALLSALGVLAAAGSDANVSTVTRWLVGIAGLLGLLFVGLQMLVHLLNDDHAWPPEP